MTKKSTRADALDERVAFRLSRSDYLVFVEKVQESGKSKSEFFRQCVLDSHVTPKANDAEVKAERLRILYLFNKAGNNINQLARAANTAYLSGEVNADLYKNILANLEDIASEMRNAISHVNQS